MSKRPFEASLSSGEVPLNPYASNFKRQKIQKVEERNFSAMELYCIMELTIHEDVRRFYLITLDLDASLFDTQDWQEIAEWMTSYFSKSQPFWFSNNVKPKVPYIAQEIKKCAMDIVANHNHGVLPKEFDELVAICENAKKMFNENAIKVLDKNRNAMIGKLNGAKITNSRLININQNKIPPIPLPINLNTMNSNMQSIKPIHKASKIKAKSPQKPVKSTENTCRKHLMSMLEKLSEYAMETQNTMRNKLEDKYQKLFEQARNELNASKFKVEEQKLLQKKDMDWLQYKKTIEDKVRQSWQENVVKLQHKFSNVTKTVIPKVRDQYFEKNPNDELIKGLLF